jgi:hypothetical protein
MLICLEMSDDSYYQSRHEPLMSRQQRRRFPATKMMHESSIGRFESLSSLPDLSNTFENSRRINNYDYGSTSKGKTRIQTEIPNSSNVKGFQNESDDDEDYKNLIKLNALFNKEKEEKEKKTSIQDIITLPKSDDNENFAIKWREYIRNAEVWHSHPIFDVKASLDINDPRKVCITYENSCRFDNPISILIGVIWTWNDNEKLQSCEKIEKINSNTIIEQSTINIKNNDLIIIVIIAESINEYDFNLNFEELTKFRRGFKYDLSTKTFHPQFYNEEKFTQRIWKTNVLIAPN